MKFPLPSGEGDRGRGQTITPRPSKRRPASVGNAGFYRHPLRPFGQLPLKGEQDFLISGPVAELAWPLKSSPAGIFDSPLPFGEGDRGRGPFLPADPAAVLALNTTLLPTDTPSVAYATAPPTRGSKTF